MFDDWCRERYFGCEARRIVVGDWLGPVHSNVRPLGRWPCKWNLIAKKMYFNLIYKINLTRHIWRRPYSLDLAHKQYH